MEILTFFWRAQHPNIVQNIQHSTDRGKDIKEGRKKERNKKKETNKESKKIYINYRC